MPYKSRAQAAYFNIHRKELEAQGVDVGEWNSASKGKKLPARVANRADGGPVTDPIKAVMGALTAGSNQQLGLGANPATSAMGPSPMMPQQPSGVLPPTVGSNPVVTPQVTGQPIPTTLPQPVASVPTTVAGMAQPTQVPNPPQQFNNGGVANLAFGGLGVVKTPNMTPTWQEKQEARNLTHGPILSNVPGRTDAHAAHVPSGSYVIPADIVSGRGQGNTLAGANSLQRLFKMGPYGSGMPALMRGHGLPRVGNTKVAGRADGGTSDPSTGKPVEVNLAGGEIVVPPENLMDVVHPNLKHAHSIMDAWVLHERKNLRNTLAKLPGPVRD